MIKISGRADRRIGIILYILLATTLGIIMVVSLMKPQHNLFSWQMILGTILGTIFLIGIFFLWNRFSTGKIAENVWVYVLLLAMFGGFLYGISCIGRNSIWSLPDYGHVWEAAAELAEGKTLSEEYYFKMYGNNIKPMLFLNVLFRLAYFLHFEDPFYFILSVSVLEVLGAVWSVGILAGDTWEERRRYRLPVLFLFAASLPVWANVQAFYTDSMSFAMGSMALAYIRLSFDARSRVGKGVRLAVAGGLAGIGIAAKMTVAIPLLAALVVLCWGKGIKKYGGYLAAFLFFAIVVQGMTTLWASNYEIWEGARQTGEPIVNWIVIGMNGDGSYYDNRELTNYITNLPSKTAKIEYSLRYIWENRSNFWNASHLAQKIRRNFASGSFGAVDYSNYALRESNVIWELFSAWGKYYWRTSQWCFCFIFSVYAIYMGGSILALDNLARKKELPAVKVVADVALLGNIIFLMIWEANNRQLYNQLPVILLGAVWNIRFIISRRRDI